MYPLFDDAFETLALVEARAPQFRPPVVNLLQNRVPLFKDPNPTLLALAMIRWRARDEATSESILAAVLADPRTRPETRAAARYLQIRFFGERMLPAAP